ncbi:MAG: hypothetical protein C4344_04315 [Acidimicrobiia bacterium]
MSDTAERSIGALPIRGNERPSRTYTPGRRCRHDGCGTILSIYNRDQYCYQHAPPATTRTRGRKIA